MSQLCWHGGGAGNAYDISLANTHDRLALFYLGTNRVSEARRHAEASVKICRKLYDQHNNLYTNDLADALMRLVLVVKVENQTGGGDPCELAEEAMKYATEPLTKLAVFALRCAEPSSP